MLAAVDQIVEQIKHKTQLRWNRIHKFRAKINFKIELGPYIVKTAENVGELLDSFKLRHEVFHREFRGVDYDGLDFDKFDYYFDHLLIVHAETQKIIGTYRLNCSTFSQESYTALEFDLSKFDPARGPYLELGRACIHKDYRKGSVISLLWRGIAEYMKACDAQVIFGCSSVKVNNARDAALLHQYFVQKNYMSGEFISQPTADFKMANLHLWNAFFQNDFRPHHNDEAEYLLPPLLKTYFKVGAKVVCEPAFDRDFDCIDVLTVLKREELASSLAQRFQIVR